jgi:hypothetical protein
MCSICGTAYFLEHRSTLQLQAALYTKYKEGPFSWNYVMKLKTVKTYCCSHCLNHVRKRKKQEMLPMDQYLLGMMSPTLSKNLDYRSKKRMEKVLNENHNMYKHICVYPANTFLSSPCKVTAWWKYNLQTRFFDNEVNANLVRKYIKV